MVDKQVEDISNWWSVVASVVNVITILLLVFVPRKQGSNYWKLINYEKGKTTAKQVVVMSLLILIVGMIGMYLAGYVCYGVIPYAAPMMIAPIPLWLAIANVFVCLLLRLLRKMGCIWVVV